MNRYGKRCVLYPRVSTEMQVDGYSLEGQKNMLTRFADREEMIVVDTYEDAGKSGKSIEGRPESGACAGHHGRTGRKGRDLFRRTGCRQGRHHTCGA